jgi:hypothetical protein
VTNRRIESPTYAGRMRLARRVAFCLVALLAGCANPFPDDLKLRSDLMPSAGAYRISAGAVLRSETSNSIKVVDCLGSLRGLRQSVVNGKLLLVIVCGTDAKVSVSFVVNDVLKETVDYCQLRQSLPAAAQFWWRDYAEVFASGDFRFCE